MIYVWIGLLSGAFSGLTLQSLRKIPVSQDLLIRVLWIALLASAFVLVCSTLGAIIYNYESLNGPLSATFETTIKAFGLGAGLSIMTGFWLGLWAFAAFADSDDGGAPAAVRMGFAQSESKKLRPAEEDAEQKDAGFWSSRAVVLGFILVALAGASEGEYRWFEKISKFTFEGAAVELASTPFREEAPPPIELPGHTETIRGNPALARISHTLACGLGGLVDLSLPL